MSTQKDGGRQALASLEGTGPDGSSSISRGRSSPRHNEAARGIHPPPDVQQRHAVPTSTHATAHRSSSLEGTPATMMAATTAATELLSATKKLHAQLEATLAAEKAGTMSAPASLHQSQSSLVGDQGTQRGSPHGGGLGTPPGIAIKTGHFDVPSSSNSSSHVAVTQPRGTQGTFARSTSPLATSPLQSHQHSPVHTPVDSGARTFVLPAMPQPAVAPRYASTHDPPDQQLSHLSPSTASSARTTNVMAAAPATSTSLNQAPALVQGGIATTPPRKAVSAAAVVTTTATTNAEATYTTPVAAGKTVWMPPMCHVTLEEDKQMFGKCVLRRSKKDTSPAKDLVAGDVIEICQEDNPNACNVLVGLGEVVEHEARREPTLILPDYFIQKFQFVPKQPKKTVLCRIQGKHLAVVTASVIEVSLIGQYLNRMSRLLMVSSIRGKCAQEAEDLRIEGMKARVDNIWIQDTKVSSAYIDKDTRIVIRSGSVRQVIVVQMTAEMRQFNMYGDTYLDVCFEFFKDLLKEWEVNKAVHKVSVILTTRMWFPYLTDETAAAAAERYNRTEDGRFYKDYYKVACQEVYSSNASSIMLMLKHECAAYWDMYDEIAETQRAMISSAFQANVLEAINLSLNSFLDHHKDRGFDTTGLNVLMITPGDGVIASERKLYEVTEESILNEGVGIDWVCLSAPLCLAAPLVCWDIPLFIEHARKKRALRAQNDAQTDTSDAVTKRQDAKSNYKGRKKRASSSTASDPVLHFPQSSYQGLYSHQYREDIVRELLSSLPAHKGSKPTEEDMAAYAEDPLLPSDQWVSYMQPEWVHQLIYDYTTHRLHETGAGTPSEEACVFSRFLDIRNDTCDFNNPSLHTVQDSHQVTAERTPASRSGELTCDHSRSELDHSNEAGDAMSSVEAGDETDARGADGDDESALARPGTGKETSFIGATRSDAADEQHQASNAETAVVPTDAVSHGNSELSRRVVVDSEETVEKKLQIIRERLFDSKRIPVGSRHGSGHAARSRKRATRVHMHMHMHSRFHLYNKFRRYNTRLVSRSIADRSGATSFRTADTGGLGRSEGAASLRRKGASLHSFYANFTRLRRSYHRSHRFATHMRGAALPQLSQNPSGALTPRLLRLSASTSTSTNAGLAVDTMGVGASLPLLAATMRRGAVDPPLSARGSISLWQQRQRLSHSFSGSEGLNTPSLGRSMSLSASFTGEDADSVFVDSHHDQYDCGLLGGRNGTGLGEELVGMELAADVDDEDDLVIPAQISSALERDEGVLVSASERFRWRWHDMTYMDVVDQANMDAHFEQRKASKVTYIPELRIVHPALSADPVVSTGPAASFGSKATVAPVTAEGKEPRKEMHLARQAPLWQVGGDDSGGGDDVNVLKRLEPFEQLSEQWRALDLMKRWQHAFIPAYHSTETPFGPPWYSLTQPACLPLTSPYICVVDTKKEKDFVVFKRYNYCFRGSGADKPQSGKDLKEWIVTVMLLRQTQLYVDDERNISGTFLTHMKPSTAASTQLTLGPSKASGYTLFRKSSSRQTLKPAAVEEGDQTPYILGLMTERLELRQCDQGVLISVLPASNLASDGSTEPYDYKYELIPFRRKKAFFSTARFDLEKKTACWRPVLKLLQSPLDPAVPPPPSVVEECQFYRVRMCILPKGNRDPDKFSERLKAFLHKANDVLRNYQANIPSVSAQPSQFHAFDPLFDNGVVENDKGHQTHATGRNELLWRNYFDVSIAPSSSKPSNRQILSNFIWLDLNNAFGVSEEPIRNEWALLYYDRCAHPTRAFHMEFQWLLGGTAVLKKLTSLLARQANYHRLVVTQTAIQPLSRTVVNSPFRRSRHVPLARSPTNPAIVRPFLDKLMFDAGFVLDMDQEQQQQQQQQQPSGEACRSPRAHPPYPHIQYIHHTGLGTVQAPLQDGLCTHLLYNTNLRAEDASHALSSGRRGRQLLIIKDTDVLGDVDRRCNDTSYLMSIHRSLLTPTATTTAPANVVVPASPTSVTSASRGTSTATHGDEIHNTTQQQQQQQQ